MKKAQALAPHDAVEADQALRPAERPLARKHGLAHRSPPSSSPPVNEVNASPIERAPAAPDHGARCAVGEHAALVQHDHVILVANLVDEMGRPQDADPFVGDETAHDLEDLRPAP